MTLDSDVPGLGSRLAVPGFDFTFRFVEAADVTAAERATMLELLQVAFNGGPNWFSLDVEPTEHMRWKSDDFPGTAQVELIEDGDEIVGMCIGLRRRFLIRGEPIAGRNGVDLALAPKAQGRGVSTVRRVQMLETWKRLNPGVSFQLSVTTHPTAWHLRDQAGIRSFGNYIETHTKVLSFSRTLRQSSGDSVAVGPSRTRAVLQARPRRLSHLLDRSRLAIRFAASVIPRRSRSRFAFDGTIVTLERFDQSVDTFWHAVAPSFDFIQVRDEAFLNWRFCDRRAGPFLIRAAVADGVLLGYAALQITSRELVIADLLTLPGRPDVVEALLRDAVQIARTRRAAMVQSWLPHVHPYREAFHGLGFVARPLSVGLGYDSWREGLDLSFLADPVTSIHVMRGDTDHI